MRALVVYESMFGNTRVVADAVADGISTVMEVTTLAVDGATEEIDEGIGLLVVGGPTHAFGLSRPSTRADAVRKYGASAPTSEALGLREWLAGLDDRPLPSRLPVATFDTRVRHPKVPGSAARRATTALRRLGCRPVVDPVTFWVEGVSGPLADGELDRARVWGAQLAASVAGFSAGSANSR